MSSSKSRLPPAKAHLGSFRPYAPGKPAREVQRELGLSDVLKLASNENALGMSPLARAALLAAVDDAWIYPDTDCYELVAAIAHHNRVPPACVMAGNGAVELIYYLTQCYLNPGDEVVTSDTSFSAYTIASRIQNASVRTAPLAGYRYDLEALAGLLTDRTRIVFVANPNNPTGTIVLFRELETFLRALPPGVLLVLDEAYHDFVQDPAYRGSLGLVLEGLPVVVLRSLSKTLGLAGLRVGYMMAREDIVQHLRQVQVPFHVNLLAQRAAIAGLKDHDHVRRTLQLIEEGKDFLYRELTAAGFEYAPTEANFLWVKAAVDAQALHDRMLQNGVIIRPGTGFGAPEHIRVTIGLPAQNRRFLQVLVECVKEVRG